MTVAELKDRMSHVEFLDWVQFYEHEAAEQKKEAERAKRFASMRRKVRGR